MKRRSFLGLLALVLPVMRIGRSKATVEIPLSGTFTAPSLDWAAGKRELAIYYFYSLAPDGRWIISTAAPVELPPAAIIPEEIWRKFHAGERIPDGPGRWIVEV